MNDTKINLPALTEEQKQHSQSVTDCIKSEIEKNGPIPFSRFMALALYAPGLGYYVAGLQKFGRHGDFVTAPEISSLFSQCLARRCAKVLSDKMPDILEFGAGSGVMAADVLLGLEGLKKAPQHYYILELSAELQQRQFDTIKNKAPNLVDRVQWLQHLPEKLSGVVLANEVLDAMPATIFHLKDDQVFERYVDWQEDRFIWVEHEADAVLKHAVEALNITNEEYISEINLVLPAWINSLSDCLQQGAVFLIDYGFERHEFYHPQRDQGTLMCHIAHHAHPDPLTYPGVQDMTTHVDFTAVAQAAQDSGLDVAGFYNQANFLINSGLTELIQQTTDPALQMQLANQVKMLTLPSEMGELFKVMVLVKNIDQT